MSTDVKNLENTQHLIMMIKSAPKNGVSALSSFADLFAILDEGVIPIVIFIFNGVLNLIKKNPKNESNRQKNESFYESLLNMASFFVFKESLERRGLVNKKLLPGVKRLNIKNLTIIPFR